MPDAPAAPSPLPTDPPITKAIIKQHKLTEAEYAIVEKSLGRAPTFTELGVFSVMWSEHCSYKSSRVHLRRLPTKGPRVIQGPGENAGVVDIGDGYAAVFKMESHNHPSFIEPYQGAATGVGGILRDVFTMGARPIASLNSLRFGRPDHPRTPELLRGVVAGIAGYGNCIGVPTVGGEVQFDARYDGNILVNAFTCGVAPTDGIFYGRASGIGNSILYIGARTGRDGIHGATMASDEFSKDGPSQRPTMQVGDPFMGKLLIEACLELFKMDVLEGIQDMGAAGLTSSSVEMGGRAENGVLLDLDLVPRRAKGMTPYEILLSESQERMLLVAKPGCEARVLEVCKKWQLDAAVIGEVTNSKHWVIKATPGYDPLTDNGVKRDARVVADIPIGVLTDNAPVYDRPRTNSPKTEPPLALTDIPLPRDLGEEILSLAGSPNVGSRRWIWEQYDHIVRGGTAVRPGSDAGVVRVPCDVKGKTVDKYLAFSSDCNGRRVEQDPFQGAAMAVAEVCRNLVCSGAEPIGLTDCLNFGNPERPDVMETFAQAIDGLAAGCKALSVPIVSGNVSLYNETDGRAILPTPTVAAVGLIADERDILTSWFKRSGDIVALLGSPSLANAGALVASEYLCRKLGKLCGQLETFDLAFEAKLQTLMLSLARKHVLSSAHDISDGGIAIALAECCTTGPSSLPDVGARADLPGGTTAEERVISLFGETPSRIVISLEPKHWADVKALAEAAGVPLTELGVTGGDSLSISFTGERSTKGAGANGAIILGTRALRGARNGCLDAIVGK